MNQIFRADVFFIGYIPVSVEYAAIVFEEGFRNLFAAGHLEVEDHAFARRAVLPEICFMVLALLVRRLHSNMGLVGLDVNAGKQIVRHHIDDRDQQFAHAQHRIVDRAQRHIDTEIAQQDRALPV